VLEQNNLIYIKKVRYRPRIIDDEYTGLIYNKEVSETIINLTKIYVNLYALSPTQPHAHTAYGNRMQQRFVI
jgi:hypothetical protein